MIDMRGDQRAKAGGTPGSDRGLTPTSPKASKEPEQVWSVGMAVWFMTVVPQNRIL